MGKCIFDEYQLVLHDREYRILVPDAVFDEFWVMPDGIFGVESDWVAGNRLAMKWIRNAYIALTKYPDSIVYFPVRNVQPVFKNVCWQISPELLLYHHHIQFKRKEWKKIKGCMKYRKPKQRVVYWNMAEFRAQHEQMLHQWRKNSSYYQRSYAERLYYQYETCFLEGSRKQSLDAVISFQKALETDLDAVLEERGFRFTAGARCCGVSYEYLTRKYIENRRKRQDI